MNHYYPHPCQFLLTNEVGKTPENVPVYRHQSWTLYTDLPVISILDQSGHWIGWGIGWIISDEGHVVSNEVRLSLLYRDGYINYATVESELNTWGGRFVVVTLDMTPRVYMDCSGLLATVFEKGSIQNHTAQITIASTTTYIAWYKNRDVVKTLLLPKKYIPIYFTNDPHCERLAVNHYLDLNTGNQYRHRFFIEETRIAEKDINDYVNAFVNIVSTQINAIVKTFPSRPIMGLTAGQDTRVLVACEGNNKFRIDHLTFRYPKQKQIEKFELFDEKLSVLISKKISLNHFCIDVDNPVKEDKELFLERIGYSNHPGKAKSYYRALKEHFNQDQPFFIGYGGETGRSQNNWRFDDNGKKPSVEFLINSLGLQHHPNAYESTKRWVKSFEYNTIDWIAALFMIELMWGCWGSPLLYGFWNKYTFAPLSHPFLYQNMIRLPIAYRLGMKLGIDMVQKRCPEIASYPINQEPSALLRLTARIQKKLTQLMPK